MWFLNGSSLGSTRSSVCTSGVSAEDEVRNVIQTGETIEDYPDDFPYPSRLVLGMARTAAHTCRGSRQYPMIERTLS